MFLEKYAKDFTNLPDCEIQNINNKFYYNIENDESKVTNKQKSIQTALIHTGVPTLEAAIRLYIEKYAKSSKIRNVADVVMHKIDMFNEENSIDSLAAKDRYWISKVYKELNNLLKI